MIINGFVSKILTHITDGLKRRLVQYKGDEVENIRKMIEIYSERFQELEDMFFEMYDRDWIENADGQLLDLIGAMIGQPRQGESDDDYRQSLYVRIGVNTSQGDPQSIINVFKLLTQSPYVHYINLGNGNIQLESVSNLTDQNEINKFFDLMERVVAAGVRIAYMLGADDTNAFGYSGPDVEGNTKGYDVGCYVQSYRKVIPFAYDGNDEDTAGYGGGSLDPLAGGEYL